MNLALLHILAEVCRMARLTAEQPLTSGLPVISQLAGIPDAIVAKGQTVNLPAGRFDRVYILVASADGDQTAHSESVPRTWN